MLKTIHCLFFLLLVLPLPVISAVLDWDVNNWPLPSLAQTYNVGGSNINISIGGATGQLNTGGNPASPETNQYLTGGTTNEDALFIRTDFTNSGQNVVITLDFTHPGGVGGLSFTFWDVDADIPQWNDRLQVTAVANSVTVNPTNVSDGITNSPIGANGSVGDPADNNNAANASADGNVTFTFNQTGITQVTIVYSNATTGNPGNQWISLHDLSFDIPPALTKSFSPDPITAGGVSTLTLNLSNNDSNTATLTANLVDNLPVGVTVANPANIGGTCPGTTNAPVGGGVITYTNGSTIPAGGCTITVDVTSTTIGTVTNTIPANALQTNLGNNATAASDTLTINAPVAPTISKTFSPDPMSINGTSTLTISLGNTNTFSATLSAALVDTLPTAGNGDVVVAAPPNIGGTCNSADVTAIAGATSVTYVNGASIPVGGCTISVDVTSAALGTYTNTIPIGALQTNLGNNAAAASDTLTVSATTPPTVSKSFSPTSINPGGTSQLTITLGNSGAAAMTLSANLDDNLPGGVTAVTVNNVATTCTDAAVDISTNTRVRYQSGATIPAGGCNIVVNVTSSTLGTVTNFIPVSALQTNAGSNSSSASANLTVTSGGGSPACPSGTNLVNLATPRNATTATSTGNVTGTISNGTGPILAIGTNVAGSGEPRLTNVPASVTLGFPDIVPLNGSIVLSLAQDNSAGLINIQDSTDNISFTSVVSFTGSNPIDDRIEHLNYNVASTNGAQFVRFTLASGGFRVDGLEYSQICQPIPQADLSISKDDSSLTYTPGGTATYTIVVTNNGPDDVTGATITDDLPNGVSMTSPWTCTPSSASSSCNTPPSVADPISISVDVANGDTITVSIPVQFSADMNDY